MMPPYAIQCASDSRRAHHRELLRKAVPQESRPKECAERVTRDRAGAASERHVRGVEKQYEL